MNGIELNASPARGTVILIHGLTGTPNEMKFLANFLYRRGYSVICPRLSHHGEPMHVLKRAKWQDFYRSVKDALLKIPSSGKVFVGGLSMGAILSLLLAAESPERISGVICLSPILFYDGWNVSRRSKLFLPLAYHTPARHILYFKEEPPYGIKNERVRRKVHQYYQKASLEDDSQAAQHGYPYMPGTLFCEMRLLIRLVKKKLPRVKAPVQIIQAEEDDITSVKNSQFIYDRVGSKEKGIVLMHNSYHVITADQERETVAEKMADFISRLTVPANPASETGESLCLRR